MLPSYFVYIGVIIQIIGAGNYLIETLQGKVKPNRVSWFLWALAPLIAFAAMISQGVGTEALATLIVGIMPALVFTASFFNKEAEWKLEKFDLVCGFFSVVGLILWQITGVGNIAILFSILADGLASVPTIVKAYKNPETEGSSAYSSGVINSGLALLTITNWEFKNYGFSLYWLIVSGLIWGLIEVGKRKNKTIAI